MRAILAGAVLLLAACSGEVPAPQEPVPATSATETPRNEAAPIAARSSEAAQLLIDGEGLRQVDPSNGGTPLVAWGTPRATVDQMVGAALGVAVDKSLSQECGAGPLEFSRFGPLTLNYMDGRLVGWYLDGRSKTPLATVSGIGIGSTRAQVMDVLKPQLIEDSTLGDEFYSDGEGLGGFFEDGKVASLYAGTTCFFR